MGSDNNNSDMVLALGILSSLFTLVGSVMIIIMWKIDVEQWRPYKSLLTFVQREGIFSSLNDVRWLWFRDSLTGQQTLDVISSVRRDTLTVQGDPRSKLNDPWEQLDMVSGALNDKVDTQSYRSPVKSG